MHQIRDDAIVACGQSEAFETRCVLADVERRAKLFRNFAHDERTALESVRGKRKQSEVRSGAVLEVITHERCAAGQAAPPVR